MKEILMQRLTIRVLVGVLLLVSSNVGLSVGVSRSEDLHLQLLEKRRALRHTILSVPGSNEIVRKIQVVQQRIARLEKNLGISDLQEQLAQLRLEACKLQQNIPELRSMLSESFEILRQVDAATKPEQQELKALAEKAKGLSEKNKEVRKIKSDIKKVEKRMLFNSKRQIERIGEINEKIYKHPGISTLLSQAIPVQKALVQRYEEIKPQIQPLDEHLSKQVSRLNEITKGKSNELRELRASMEAIKKEIVQADPCYLAKKDVDQKVTWDMLFVS
jgi:DNA repair exonuclease SbcCD ATPase subunit